MDVARAPRAAPRRAARPAAPRARRPASARSPPSMYSITRYGPLAGVVVVDRDQVRVLQPGRHAAPRGRSGSRYSPSAASVSESTLIATLRLEALVGRQPDDRHAAVAEPALEHVALAEPAPGRDQRRLGDGGPCTPAGAGSSSVGSSEAGTTLCSFPFGRWLISLAGLRRRRARAARLIWPADDDRRRPAPRPAAGHRRSARRPRPGDPRARAHRARGRRRAHRR